MELKQKMSKEEFVEITVKVPENAIKALREYILPHDQITEEEYWQNSVVGDIVADLEYIASHQNPMKILEKYDLTKYH